MMSKELTIESTQLEPEVSRSETAPLPLVSVLIPCRNEERGIARSLDAILASDYPGDRLEILVVDGMSDDKTREIVQRYAAQYSCVRLLDNVKKHIPAAFNVGVQNARGETIMLMSGHSACERDYIRLCVTYQEKYRAENVGGVWKMLPGTDTAVAHAIVAGLRHRFGSGNARIKVGASQPTWSDAAAFGCFKKELFSRIGLFDERLRRSSDMDLNMRIRAAGGRILLVPEIVVNYYADSTLKKFWNHNFADGVWATYVMKFGSKGWSWRHWAPLGFVASLLISFALAPFFSAFRWLGLGILAVYGVVSLSASLQIASHEKSIKQFFLLPLVFAIRHVAHGLGALFGLILVLLPGQVWQGSRGLKS